MEVRRLKLDNFVTTHALFQFNKLPSSNFLLMTEHKKTYNSSVIE